MPNREILRLGNPKLVEVCSPVEERELKNLKSTIADLHDTLMDFREQYNAGRAIAAPQIGVMKRLIYVHINDEPKVIINPVLYQKSKEFMTFWDDCMCFPNLLVKVRRHKSCKISYWDESWNKKQEYLEGDLAELLQHECDHLYGILAVSRAIDSQSFALRSEINFLRGRIVNTK